MDNPKTTAFNITAAIGQYEKTLDLLKYGMEVYNVTPDNNVLLECAKGLERLGYDGNDHALHAWRATSDGMEEAVRGAFLRQGRDVQRPV